MQMKTGAHEGQPGLGRQAIAHRPAEIHQQEHRERAERAERGDVAVGQHLVADGEEARHHDRRTPAAAKRRQAEVALREPMHPQPRSQPVPWMHRGRPTCPHSSGYLRCAESSPIPKRSFGPAHLSA